MKKINKIQSNKKAKVLSTYNLERSGSWRIDKTKVRQVLPNLFAVVFLGIWISLSVQHNNLHLNEALICSFIIVSILFFRTAEQKGDLETLRK